MHEVSFEGRPHVSVPYGPCASSVIRTWYLTECVCHVWSDAEIQVQISAWQGCDAELASVADELARHYELGGR